MSSTGRRRGAGPGPLLLEELADAACRAESGASSSTWPVADARAARPRRPAPRRSRGAARGIAEAVAVEARWRRRGPRRRRRCGRSAPNKRRGSLLRRRRAARPGLAVGRPATPQARRCRAPRSARPAIVAPSRARCPRARAPRRSSSAAANASSSSRCSRISAWRAAVGQVGEVAAAPRRACGGWRPTARVVVVPIWRARRARCPCRTRDTMACGDVGDALEVVGRAGGDRTEHDVLRHAAAEQHRHVVEQLVLRSSGSGPPRAGSACSRAPARAGRSRSCAPVHRRGAARRRGRGRPRGRRRRASRAR